MPRTKPTESALRRSRNDPQAFTSFYDAHADGVLRFFARRTYDVEIARDLTAETFAQAFRGRDGFRGHGEVEAAAWLYGIARHLLTRYIRRGIVERKALRQLGIELPELDERDIERVVELAGLAELHDAVAGAFGQLQPEQRDAVQLRIVDEQSYAEIAERLGISEQTARARVSRGLRQLAATLDAVPQIREMTI
jgi:RNA polymerase sigma-70 factor (ECF subfamily)